MTWGKDESAAMTRGDNDDGWGSPEEDHTPQRTQYNKQQANRNNNNQQQQQPITTSSSNNQKGNSNNNKQANQELYFEMEDFDGGNSARGGGRGGGGGYQPRERGGGGQRQQGHRDDWDERDSRRPQPKHMRGDDEYRGGRGGGYEDRQGPPRGARRQDQGDNQYGRNDRYGQMDENHNNRRGPPDWQESRGERGGGQYDRGYGGGAPGGRGGDRDGQDRREGPPRGDFVRRESYIPPDVADGDEGAIGGSIRMGENFGRYEDIEVKITGPGNEEIKRLDGTFDNAQLAPILIKTLTENNYHQPTPVQKCAIPCILAQKDIMACAQTGSGKTAAFLLPVISKLIEQNVEAVERGRQTPQVVIIEPTRELATQVYGEAVKFTRNTRLRAQVVYGGTDTRHQKSKTSSGCNILIGTPGRLEDFVSKDWIGLEECQYFILDEADRMLDMGFEPSMRKIAGDHDMPDVDERHTLLFSATMPDNRQKLAKQFLRPEYLFIEVGIVGGACQDVVQEIIRIENNEAVKSDKLEELVTSVAQTNKRTLVFVETKRKADFIACMLSQTNIPTTSIHGGRLQPEREQALRDFKTGQCPILVATSVAARGLDIPEVEHVINYELPNEIEDYVHRIGRTGRCGNIGRSTSFYDEKTDAHLAQSLLKVLSDAQQTVPDWLVDCAEQAKMSGYNSFRGGARMGGRDAREPRGSYRDRHDRGGPHDYGARPSAPPSRSAPPPQPTGSGPPPARERVSSRQSGSAPQRCESEVEWDDQPRKKSSAPPAKVDNDSDGWSD